MDQLECTDDELIHYTPLEEGVSPSQEAATAHIRLKIIEHTLVELQKYLETIIRLVREELSDVHEPPRPPFPDSPDEFLDDSDYNGVVYEQQLSSSQEVRGIFTGDTVRTDRGDEITVPANYASKSRLVQGDVLGVYTGSDGRHVFKQIGPVKRRRTQGILERDQKNRLWYVRCPEGRLRILTTSVSYFKGIPGATVHCIIPAKGMCFWGAVEYIGKSSS